MKKLTAIFALLFAICTSYAQPRNISATTFGHEEMYEYTEWMRGDIAEKIYAEVEKGRLVAYKTRLLDKPFTALEFRTLGEKRIEATIPNPENPDDPYDLMDTVFYEYINPLLIKAIELDYPKVLVIKVDDVNTAFFNLAEVKKQLYGDQQTWIDFFIAKKFIILDRQNLKKFAEKDFKQLALKWYEMVLKRNVTAYQNKRLDETYTIEEIKDRGALKEVIMTRNPNNPNDEHDFIDTVFTTPFNPDTISRLLVYQSWNLYGKGGVSVSKHAYAPMYNPMVAGIPLPLTPMFLLKPAQADPFFTQEENGFYGNFFTFLLRNRGTNEVYRDSVYEGE